MSSCTVSALVLRSSRVNRVKQVWECSLISFPAPPLQICISLCEHHTGHQHTPNSTGTGWSARGSKPCEGQQVNMFVRLFLLSLCVCFVCTAALLKLFIFIHSFSSLPEGFTVWNRNQQRLPQVTRRTYTMSHWSNTVHTPGRTTDKSVGGVHYVITTGIYALLQ